MNLISWLFKRTRKPNNIPLFCRTCGTEIIVEKTGEDFDPMTGQPARYQCTAYCPNPDYECPYSQRFHYVEKWYEENNVVNR